MRHAALHLPAAPILAAASPMRTPASTHSCDPCCAYCCLMPFCMECCVAKKQRKHIRDRFVASTWPPACDHSSSARSRNVDCPHAPLLRYRFGLKAKTGCCGTGDCCTHLCCTKCSLCQEARELNLREQMAKAGQQLDARSPVMHSPRGSSQLPALAPAQHAAHPTMLAPGQQVNVPCNSLIPASCRAAGPSNLAPPLPQVMVMTATGPQLAVLQGPAVPVVVAGAAQIPAPRRGHSSSGGSRELEMRGSSGSFKKG